MGAAVAAVALLTVTGCSGASGGGGDSASVAGDAGGASASRPEPAVRAGDSLAGRTEQSAVQRRAVVKTGTITVTSRKLTEARDRVDDLVRTWGGTVDRERTTNDQHGRVARSTLVLRVPADEFDRARKTLAGLGKVRSAHQSERDVTTEVIDTDERVQTLQNSLDRLQRFQRTAKDVRDLLRYESEITSRQAELQSTQAQQRYLSDQTSMSTITLTLERPEAAPPGALDDAGFLAGLGGGWRALVDAAVVAMTVLGAVLPFALVVALVAVPVWVALRRRRRPAPRPAPAE